MNMAAKSYGAPFNRPDADVILRSSDNVDFRVHKLILSIASPFFEQMFSLPTPPPPEEEDESWHAGLPLVPMTESGATIELVLRFMYPIPSPKVTLEDIGALLEFSRKYDVHICDAQVDFGLRNSVASDPVGVYALSLAYNLPDIGKLAAVAACQLPTTKLDSPLLDYLSARQYRQLMATRIQAGNVLFDLLSGQSFYVETSGSFPSGYHPFCQHCSTKDGDWVLHQVYKRYLETLRVDIRTGAGTGVILVAVDILMPAETLPCPGYTGRCKGLPKAAFRYFAESLHTAAQEVCSKVVQQTNSKAFR